MSLSRCDFRGTEDLARVKSFLLGRQQWRSLPDYWTAGMSTVGTFQTIYDSALEDHQFWCDEQKTYHAHLWIHAEATETVDADGNSWRMFIHPEFRTKELASSIIRHAESRLSEQPDQPVSTVAYGKDSWLTARLSEHGYAQQKAVGVHMRRDLSEPIEEPRLASGYVLRPLDPRTDLVQRAGAQSDAFAGVPEPGEWAIENGKRFLRWYEGRDDLDLVAVTTSGEIASFGVFLVDPCTRVGELDPVGTRVAHQRRGLSRAVLLSGLNHLVAKGMQHAAVRTGVSNVPAIRTYEAAGFAIVDHLYRYIKVTSLP